MRFYEADQNLPPSAKTGCTKGSLDAFEKILNRYESLVYNIAYQYFPNANDVKHATIESMLEMYYGLNRIPSLESNSLKTWICSVTAKNCLKMSRKHRLDKSRIQPKTTSAFNENMSDCERTLKMVEAIHKLSCNHRIIFILKHTGLSYAELETALNISASKVKSRLSQARKELVSYLN